MNSANKPDVTVGSNKVVSITGKIPYPSPTLIPDKLPLNNSLLIGLFKLNVELPEM